eukprot:c18734_g1_i1 orf=241-3768(+)
MAMEVESASLCNVVIKYLLDQQYLLTAFELMHELIEDGHSDRATRLQQIFSDPDTYPPDEILRLQNLQVANPQRVVEERDAADERATIMEYELRLAKDDIKRLQEKLDMQADTLSRPNSDGEGRKSTELDKQELIPDAKSKAQNFGPVRDPLRESERRALNWAVKEYLLAAGYKLTAMTFYEEVDQDLDVPQAGPMYIPDALRHCYHQLQAASPEAIQEKMMLQEEKELLLKDKQKLIYEKETIARSKETLDQEIVNLTKSLEASLKDLKDRDKKISELKESMELASKDMNGCRMEITALKLELESLKASKGHDSIFKEDTTSSIQESMQFYKAEVESLRSQLELANMVRRDANHQENVVMEVHMSKDMETDSTARNGLELKDLQIDGMVPESLAADGNGVAANEPQEGVHHVVAAAELEQTEARNVVHENHVVENVHYKNSKQEVETVEVLADALPKIVPYVLINHREELLPLIMCAIERHPDSSVRDLLTHTLFNLIKRPDATQRRIIMDACVTLSKNIGEERTELELLPQCWEQINHKYEERRLLVAQSCGELSQFVKAEIRTSLILSIIQQLIEDPEAVVREAASHNLAILLPCFPSMDKYFKVEELMFQLILDPSGVVVEMTLKELVPAVVTWANNGNQPLSQLLRLLFSHILASAQHCPPVSGVEGSMEARLRVLGERERWNLDVLLRMLTGLLPEVVKLVKATCPYKDESTNGRTEVIREEDSFFSESLIKDYLRGREEWLAFDWLHVDCLPLVLQVACMLSSREDSLRSRLSKLLAGIINHFGNHYLSSIMLPIFLTAVGDSANLSQFPPNLVSRVKALKPKTDIDERLAILCVLPLFLAGVLGVPSMQEQLAVYLRSLVLQYAAKNGALTPAHTPELIDAVRFLCTCEEQHTVIVGVLWELVVNSNPDVKISAANIMKVLVPYVNAKIATHDVMPALVTLGSDPNLLVKYSSIEAFGAVAQHFKDEVIMDKIRVQMDAFLDDGSHEATVAVIRTLAVAVPLTTSSLRDYLLQKLLLLTGGTLQGATLLRRRDKVDAFCEAIRALDATDLSPTNVKELLLPVIQNLLKDIDALDPAHKEALELILKERSGGRLETITKAMGNHLSFTGVTNLFGDTGFLAKKEAAESIEPLSPKQQPPAQEEGRLFNRFMRGNFSDMIRGRGKTTEG